jgi:hypothetical protein
MAILRRVVAHLSAFLLLGLPYSAGAQSPAADPPQGLPAAPAPIPVVPAPDLPKPREPVLSAAQVRCQTAFLQVATNPRKAPRNFCRALASVAFASIATQKQPPKPEEQVTSSDVQPERTDTAGAQGSSGQASAAPRGTPVSFAGGAIAIAGTGVGTRAVTSIALNPLSLFGNESDVNSTAFTTRFLDVAVVLPFSLSESVSAESTEDVDFVGLRVRANFLAFSNADAVVKDLNAAYEKALRAQGDLTAALEQHFLASEDPAACLKSIQDDDSELIAANCPGLDLSGRQMVLDAEELVSKQRAEIVAQADNDYLGLDVRGDFGDQNLSMEGDQDGTSMTGAVAFGRRLGVSAKYGIWIRGRGGVVYQDLETDTDPLFSGDGQLGLALSAVPGRAGFDFAAALEGRFGDTENTVVDTDYLQLRLSTSVPMSGDTGLSLGVALPLAADGDRDRDPILTVAFDWGLSLSDGLGKAH